VLKVNAFTGAKSAAPPPASPACRIVFDFPFSRGPEGVANVQIGRTRDYFYETLCRQIAHDVGGDSPFHQLVIESRILAVKLSVANGECLVLGKISGPIELDIDLLAERTNRE